MFEYHEAADGTVFGTYAGGYIRLGFLVGIRERDQVSFRYSHVTEDRIASGHCRSRIEVLSDGRLRLHERWTWDYQAGSGSSILEEAKPGLPRSNLSATIATCEGGHLPGLLP